MSNPTIEQSEDYMHQLHPKAKYSKTTMKKKAQLVDLVINQQWSIYKASKKLKLSNSTAKSILKNFEKYGTLLEKFTKNRILQLREMERSEDNLFKTTPTVKEEPSDDKVSVKAEHESANEKEAGTLENNEDYYPFLSYAVPLYFEYRPA